LALRNLDLIVVTSISNLYIAEDAALPLPGLEVILLHGHVVTIPMRSRSTKQSPSHTIPPINLSSQAAAEEPPRYCHYKNWKAYHQNIRWKVCGMTIG